MINADNLEIYAEAQISVATVGPGEGGVLRIQIDRLEVREGVSQIIANAKAGQRGNITRGCGMD